MRSRRPHVRHVACTAALALSFAFVPGVASAQSAARKVGRGLAAMTTGFLEVPGNIVEVTRERGAGWGFTLGFVQGLGMIVVRELVGVYEFVSAPFPLPSGFQPIIQPEFPWDYFDRSRSTGGKGPNRAGRGA
jgi:putative exosortase-associated protein (TIGR04073 family)